MRNRCGHVVVPVSALRPLLQSWVDKQDKDEGGDGGYGIGTNGLNKGLGRLAEECGLPVRRLNGILHDNLPYKNIRFDTADKLLCGMQMTSEWHVSLAEYYVELEVAPYERDRNVPILITDAA